MNNPLVSVIIPVYNVRAYLPRCLNSVIGQTYQNLEILVIDDGSTDGCYRICEKYAKKDSRIRLFHTPNQGLSATRNHGLDIATGEFIAFVDSDDWIDPDLLEQAISHIGDADFLYFGYDNHHPISASYSRIEALNALIDGTIVNSAWSKLYRRECFTKNRFPEGRIFEDIAIMHRIIITCTKVNSSDIPGYNYRLRNDSLSQNRNTKNLIDYWLAYKDQYDACVNLVDEERCQKLLVSCASAIGRAWAWRNKNSSSVSPEWDKMSHFVKTKLPHSVRKFFPFRIRVGIFFARFNQPISFWLSNKMSILEKQVRNLSRYLK